MGDTVNLPQQAGILCNTLGFRRYVAHVLFGSNVEVSTTAAAQFLRTKCGIISRSELASNPNAAKKFQIMRTEYDAARGKIGRPK